MAVLRLALGAFFVGLMAAAFAVSFAAIVYQGELATFLERGVALTLMGSVVVAVVGALTLTYRGAIIAPQDVPAILIASASGAIVASGQVTGEALFATTACLIAVSSLITGVAKIAVGHFKLAYVARYVPYPVLAGFLAATGLLLLQGGIGVALGSSHDMWARLADSSMMRNWVPVVVAAIGIVVATRLSSSHFVLPVALLVVGAGFYAYFALMGLSMAEARDAGFLLGPFQDSGSGIAWMAPLVLQADWPLIATQAPVILTVVAVSLIGVTLNASGLELAIEQELDISQEVRGSGIANALASVVGGLPSYHIVGESILAHRLGLRSALAGLSSAAGCGLVLVLGAQFLSVLPVGFFAAAIAFLGVDLMYSWLWEERRKLHVLDYAIVVLIPLVAVAFSFLTAIALGLLLACAIFVVAYAKLDVLRSQTDVSARRSVVERSQPDLQVLARKGHQALVIELQGYLFFGSSNDLREKLRDLLAGHDKTVHWVVLDFAHVSGLDVSARRVVRLAVQDCLDRGLAPVVSGPPHLDLGDIAEQSQGLAVFDQLDAALEHVEDAILAAARASETDQHGVASQLEALLAANAFGGFAKDISLEPGEVLVQKGGQSKDIYVVRTGRLTVSLPGLNGAPRHVARVREGAILGEMAYYADADRSADITAETHADLWFIDMSKLPTLEAEHPEMAAQFHRLLAASMASRLARTTRLLADIGA